MTIQSCINKTPSYGFGISTFPLEDLRVIVSPPVNFLSCSVGHAANTVKTLHVILVDKRVPDTITEYGTDWSYTNVTVTCINMIWK